MMTQRVFSPETKLHIVRHLVSGEKYLSQLSREYKVSHTAMSNWREVYQAKGEAAFFRNEIQERSVEVLEGRIAELERFCGQLSLENAVRKKALHLLPSSNATREPITCGSRCQSFRCATSVNGWASIGAGTTNTASCKPGEASKKPASVRPWNRSFWPFLATATGVWPGHCSGQGPGSITNGCYASYVSTPGCADPNAARCAPPIRGTSTIAIRTSSPIGSSTLLIAAGSRPDVHSFTWPVFWMRIRASASVGAWDAGWTIPLAIFPP